MNERLKKVVARIEHTLNGTHTVFLGTRYENGMRVSEAQRVDGGTVIALDIVMEGTDEHAL